MPIVEMPDGALVEMPENPTPEQLSKLRAATSQGPLARVADTVGRGARSLVAGFGKTAAGAPDALGMVLNAPSQVVNLAREAVGAPVEGDVPYVGDQFRELADSVREYWSKFGEKGLKGYPGAVLEGVGGAAAVPTPSGPLTGLAVGGGAGAGGEAAANAMGDTPINRLVGSLIGGVATGGAAAVASRVRPQTADLAREGIEGLSPEALSKAQAFMRESQARGIRVDLAQALEATGTSPGNMATIRNTLANSKSGNTVQEILREQPSELEALATALVKRTPGKAVPLDQAANNVQEAATARITAEKGVRTKLWEGTLDSTKQQLATRADADLRAATGARQSAGADLSLEQSRTKAALADVLAGRATPDDLKARIPVEAAATARDRLAQEALRSAEAGAKAVNEVPRETVLDVAQKLAGIAASSPNTAKGQAIANLRRKLFDAQGRPITDPKQLNDILVGEAARLKDINLASKGVDAGAAKWIGLQIQEVRKDLGKTFAPIRAANEAYTNFTEAVINPLKQGPVGQFATPRGYKPDVAASRDKLLSLLDRGEAPGPKSNIRTLARELQSADPNAFPDAFKTYLQTKLGEAFPAKIAGATTTAPEAASRVYNTLFANRNQYNGLRQAAAASAQSLGADPVAVTRGLDSFAQITKALTNRPASVGGLSPRDATAMAGQNVASDSMRIFSFMPVEKAARRVEEAVMAKTYRELDKLLTTPEGVAKLAELGAQPVMSKKALTIFATIGGTTPGMVQGEP